MGASAYLRICLVMTTKELRLCLWRELAWGISDMCLIASLIMKGG